VPRLVAASDASDRTTDCRALLVTAFMQPCNIYAIPHDAASTPFECVCVCVCAGGWVFVDMCVCALFQSILARRCCSLLYPCSVTSSGRPFITWWRFTHEALALLYMTQTSICT
jgi:hypothetical protein